MPVSELKSNSSSLNSTNNDLEEANPPSGESNGSNPNNSSTADVPKDSEKDANGTSNKNTGIISKDSDTKNHSVSVSVNNTNELNADQVKTQEQSEIPPERKYPILAFSQHPFYKILFKREAGMDSGKLVTKRINTS